MSIRAVLVISFTAWVTLCDAEIINVGGSITSSCSSICKQHNYGCDDSVFTTADCNSMASSYCGESLAYTKYQISCNQGTCYADCSQEAYYNKATNLGYCDLVSECYEVHQSYEYQQICPCVSSTLDNPSMFYGVSGVEVAAYVLGCIFFLVIVLALLVYFYFEVLAVRIHMHKVVRGAATDEDLTPYQRAIMSVLSNYDHFAAKVRPYFTSTSHFYSKCTAPIRSCWEDFQQRRAEHAAARIAAREAELSKKSRFKKTKREWMKQRSNKKKYEVIDEENGNDFDEVSWYRESSQDEASTINNATAPVVLPSRTRQYKPIHNASPQQETESDDSEHVINAIRARVVPAHEIRQTLPATRTYIRESPAPRTVPAVRRSSYAPESPVSPPATPVSTETSPVLPQRPLLKRIDLSRQESEPETPSNQFAAYEKRPVRQARRGQRVTSQQQQQN